MSGSRRHLDELRRQATEVENDLIDELSAGHIGRREFLRHGTVLGMSAPLLLATLGGLAYSVAPRSARAATAGGTVRVAQTTPSGAIDPITGARSWRRAGSPIRTGQSGHSRCARA